MRVYIEDNLVDPPTTNATFGDKYNLGAAGLTLNQWNCI